MLNRMSEAQRSVLRFAAARDDRLLQPPANARGAVAKSLAAKLIDAGWAKEVKAPKDAPVWRRDQTADCAYALRLTARGLKVAAADEEARGGEKVDGPDAAKQDAATRRAPKPFEPQLACPNDAQPAVSSNEMRLVRPPRADSKLGGVLARLSAGAGATISELMASTGWLEHTTRAALTGLRRRGYTLSLTRRERDGASVYRIAETRAEAVK